VDSKFYFQKTEYPMLARELPACVYVDPSKEMMDRFFDINGLADGNAMIYPGRNVIVPSLEGTSPDAADSLKSIIPELNSGLKPQANGFQSQLFNSDFDLMEMLVTHKGKLDYADKMISGLDEYLASRVGSIKRDLTKLQKVYGDLGKDRIRFSSDEGKRLRAPLEQSLKNQISGFSKKVLLKRPDAKSIKDALGISHKSIDKHFRTNGSPVDIKRFKQAITKTEDLARKLKPLGTFGKLLNIGTSATEVMAAYKEGGARKATAAAVGEFAEIGGGMALGAAASGAMLLFGVGTGGVGFVVIGLVAASANMIGSEIAADLYETHGEKVVENLIARP
jgi:hypothetical protein